MYEVYFQIDKACSSSSISNSITEKFEISTEMSSKYYSKHILKLVVLAQLFFSGRR
jgi:hypothetical protein